MEAQEQQLGAEQLKLQLPAWSPSAPRQSLAQACPTIVKGNTPPSPRAFI
jgi:hypothetical protein